MAVTCNSFADNTVSQTQNTLGCTNEPVNISDNEMPLETFLLTVLDMLDRAGLGVSLADYDPCDGVEVSRLAFCELNAFTPGIQNPPAKIKAAILWLLNERLCNP